MQKSILHDIHYKRIFRVTKAQPLIAFKTVYFIRQSESVFLLFLYFHLTKYLVICCTVFLLKKLDVVSMYLIPLKKHMDLISSGSVSGAGH